MAQETAVTKIHALLLRKRTIRASSLAISAVRTSAPPLRVFAEGCSPAHSHAQVTPKTTSNCAKREISGAGSSLLNRTTRRQGRANWNAPSNDSKHKSWADA